MPRLPDGGHGDPLRVRASTPGHAGDGDVVTPDELAEGRQLHADWLAEFAAGTNDAAAWDAWDTWLYDHAEALLTIAESADRRRAEATRLSDQG